MTIPTSTLRRVENSSPYGGNENLTIFWAKILFRSRSFGQKWNFWKKLILVNIGKNELLGQKINFGKYRKKTKFWAKKRNFGKKIKLLDKKSEIRINSAKMVIWLKIENFDKK